MNEYLGHGQRPGRRSTQFWMDAIRSLGFGVWIVRIFTGILVVTTEHNIQVPKLNYWLEQSERSELRDKPLYSGHILVGAKSYTQTSERSF
jgi:hypothetical protein